MNPPMWTLALQGFRKAHARHDRDRLTTDPTRVFISAAECVYWAATIDERLREWPGYKGFTDTHPVGSLLPGVRYVRNLKTHILPMTLQRVEGKMYPVIYPVVYAEVVWLPLEQLPKPSRTSKYIELQERSYSEQMAGSPTRNTLYRLMEGFADLEALPNSPFEESSWFVSTTNDG
ncbi:hypothetical protein GCM10007170_28270 [Arthrobacter liuii]|uniref:Uncharacterized protein n=1 Tax=Arthrobacter liuii TaxID=1476996 RepID=A0ABQ2AY50_9MICC|nr:hypothetical protein GCM10007170_28270 [Arthrobacter liuii]